MDNFLLSHRNPIYQQSVADLVHTVFNHYDVSVHPDKSSPHPLRDINFISYPLFDRSIYPPNTTISKSIALFQVLTPRHYDFKILQDREYLFFGCPLPSDSMEFHNLFINHSLIDTAATNQHNIFCFSIPLSPGFTAKASTESYNPL